MARASNPAKDDVQKWLVVQQDRIPFQSISKATEAAIEHFPDAGLKPNTVRNWVVDAIPELSTNGKRGRKKVIVPSYGGNQPVTIESLERQMENLRGQAVRALRNDWHQLQHLEDQVQKTREGFQLKISKCAEFTGRSVDSIERELAGKAE